MPVTIPPLRERRGDIPLLVEHFLRRFAASRTVSVSADALHVMEGYGWPGNIRELRNGVQRIVLFCGDEIGIADLPPELRGDHPLEAVVKACNRCFTEQNMTFEEVVAWHEVNLLRQALKDANGNRSRAAQLLKMSPSTFRDKLKEHSLNGSE